MLFIDFQGNLKETCVQWSPCIKWAPDHFPRVAVVYGFDCNTIMICLSLSCFIDYCKLLKVTTLITFGNSSLWGLLLLWGRYFQGVITSMEQQTLYKIEMAELFLRKKKDEH